MPSASSSWGTGSDGSRGAREIKRCGGRVFVESPDSAKFDGMPLSALATGIVDQSAPAPDLPKLLMDDEIVTVQPELEDPFEDETPMESNFQAPARSIRLGFLPL